MILSNRERTIIWVTAAALGLFLADRFILSPILERRSRIDAESGECQATLEKADGLFAQRKRLMPRYRELIEAGLGTGAGAAESRLLHAIQGWAQEADLNLSSVKHERTEMERQFQKITWRAAGTGTMTAISRFIWRIQEATLPIRIADLQVSGRQEGTDSLTIQVGVSTLGAPSKVEKEKAPVEGSKAALREKKE